MPSIESHLSESHPVLPILCLHPRKYLELFQTSEVQNSHLKSIFSSSNNQLSASMKSKRNFSNRSDGREVIQHFFNWNFLLFASGSKEDVTNGIRRCSGDPPHDTLCAELYTIAIAQATGRGSQHTKRAII